MAERQPWDQLPDETDEAYARFEMYKSLGPGRSIRRAYATYIQTFRNAANSRQKPQHVPGHWGDDSAKYRWIERAEKWDGYVIREFAQRAAAKFVGALDILASKVAAAIANPKMKPKDWRDVLASLDVLAKYLRPESTNGSKPGGGTDGDPAPKPDRAAVE